MEETTCQINKNANVAGATHQNVAVVAAAERANNSIWLMNL